MYTVTVNPVAERAFYEEMEKIASAPSFLKNVQSAARKTWKKATTGAGSASTKKMHTVAPSEEAVQAWRQANPDKSLSEMPKLWQAGTKTGLGDLARFHGGRAVETMAKNPWKTGIGATALTGAAVL